MSVYGVWVHDPDMNTSTKQPGAWCSADGGPDDFRGSRAEAYRVMRKLRRTLQVKYPKAKYTVRVYA